MRSYLAQVHNMDGLLYLDGNTPLTKRSFCRFDDDYARMMSGSGPGYCLQTRRVPDLLSGDLESCERRQIGHDARIRSPIIWRTVCSDLVPTQRKQNPSSRCASATRITSGWKFNSAYGNTPASFVFLQYWSPIGDNNGGNYTEPGLQSSRRLVQYSRKPTPSSRRPTTRILGFSTAISSRSDTSSWRSKGSMITTIRRIGWEQDWRCRNWIQAPPFYLGKGLYMSEDDTIGNTQRMDCPL